MMMVVRPVQALEAKADEMTDIPGATGLFDKLMQEATVLERYILNRAQSSLWLVLPRESLLLWWPNFLDKWWIEACHGLLPACHVFVFTFVVFFFYLGLVAWGCCWHPFGSLLPPFGPGPSRFGTRSAPLQSVCVACALVKLFLAVCFDQVNGKVCLIEGSPVAFGPWFLDLRGVIQALRPGYHSGRG